MEQILAMRDLCLLSLCQAFKAGINPVACQLNGNETHTFTQLHTKKMNSQANRQANAHKLVHMFAHKLTEASLFYRASQNLGPLSR